MDPALVRGALEAVVTATTGILAESLFWVRRPRGMQNPQYAILKLTGFSSRGRDEIFYDHDAARPVGAELIPHQVGLRDVVWQVQVWSHNATDVADALSLVMALRDRIHLDEYRDALQAVDIGIADVASMVDLGDQKQDHREMSVAQLDVRLNAKTDETGTALGYVDTWQITGTATLPDGGTALIIDDEVMP